MEPILDGLELLLTPAPLYWLTIGVAIGFLVGVLPGFESTNAAALFLPFSVTLTTESALLLMVGIYAGSNFAGAVPAILMNVPGTASAAATAMDGWPMTQKGQAPLAIGLARMASTVGGVIAAVVILAIIGPLSRLALAFQTPEMFMVAVLGLLVIGSLLGRSSVKGLVSAFMGLILAAMAVNPLTAQPRFTFGLVELYEGVPFVPVIIGLFAFTQMFLLASQDTFNEGLESSDGVATSGFIDAFRGAKEGVVTTLRYPGLLVRSSLLGVGIGIMPGMGTAVANFIAYADARRRSKHPERFGEGAPEGVIACESCENAVVAGTLVPTLTLGIPGSGTAAIMLAALYLHGVQPGPRVMESHAAEAYAVLLGVLVASLLILPLGILLASPMTLITRLKPMTLVPPVLIICIVGTYALRNSVFDVGLAVLFGLIGLLMRKTGYPVVPLVLGLILGPIVEANFLRALLLSNNSPIIFFESTVSRVLWAIIASLAIGKAVRLIRGRGPHAGAAGGSEPGGERTDDQQPTKMG